MNLEIPKNRDSTRSSLHLATLITICSAFCNAQVRAASIDFEPAVSQQAFMEARGRIQHLISLQKANLTPPLQKTSETTDEHETIKCIEVETVSDNLFEQCATQTHAQSVTTQNQMHKFRAILLAENALLRPSLGTWKAWLKLSAAMAIFKENKIAKKLFEVARTKALRDAPNHSWTEKRLDFFSAALDVNTSRDFERLNKIHLSLLSPIQKDSSLDLIRSKLIAVLESQGVVFRSGDSTETRQERMRELSYLKWQMVQDRDELEAVKQALLEDRFSIDLISRLENLSRFYATEDREWRVIADTLSRVSANVSLLSRSKGLHLVMENWMSAAGQTDQVTRFEEDNSISKTTSVALELSSVLSRLIESHVSRLKSKESAEIAQELSHRMKLISTPVSVTFNNSLFERDLLFSRTIKERIRAIQKRIHRGHALLAAQYFSHEIDANIAQDIRTARNDLNALEDLRHDLVLDFFSEYSFLDPRSQLQYRALMRIIAQIRKTNSDFKKLLSGEQVNGKLSTADSAYFSESESFISMLEKDAVGFISKRSMRVKSLFAEIKPLQDEMTKINELSAKFLRDSSADLMPKLREVVAQMSAKIENRIGHLELSTNLENAAMLDALRKKKDALQLTKERLEDLRRIRSENLEWRIAQ